MEYLLKYDPIVRECLGTSRGQPDVEVAIGSFPSRIWGATWKEGPAQGIFINLAPPWGEKTLVHELIHWHMADHWETLPACLEEGLACSISDGLFEVMAGSIYPGPPTVDDLRVALEEDKRGSPEELLRDEGYGRYALAGRWMVEAIGLRRLKELTLQARDQGLERVPIEQILELLPPPATGVVIEAEPWNR